MSKLLELDIHHLADTRRFSHPASSARMTLDREISSEWIALFEKTQSTSDWDCLLKICERLPNHIYLAAKEAAAGRDSRSQRIAESRQRAANFLDSI